MATKPILFSGPMVRAILEGRKTMTRRVLGEKLWLDAEWGLDREPYLKNGVWVYDKQTAVDDSRTYELKPRYQPGDILWVREKWRSVDFEYCDCKWSASIEYADGARGIRVFWYDNSDVGIPSDSMYEKTGWRPSIFMPKGAARIFLRVTDVRAERLQEITHEDCYREGMVDLPGVEPRPRSEFASLWDGLNAKRGYSWDANPWVWVVSFKRVDKPNGWQEVPHDRP